MEEGAAKSLLATSILGTLRIFVVILAGFLASKWPKHERTLKKYLEFFAKLVIIVDFSIYTSSIHVDLPDPCDHS